MALKEIDDPDTDRGRLGRADTRVCGICGSDSKQVLMDFEAADDNMMTAFITFPQVLGHEVVATVGQVGPGVRRRRAGPASRAEPLALL